MLVDIVNRSLLRQTPDGLWWGFENRDGVLHAELEKAMVDMWYLNSRGTRQFETDEWHTTAVNKQRLRQYLKRAGLPLRLCQC